MGLEQAKEETRRKKKDYYHTEVTKNRRKR
jgi:hypothetical protein